MYNKGEIVYLYLVLRQVFSALRLCLFANAISSLYQGTCGLVVTLLVLIGA